MGVGSALYCGGVGTFASMKKPTLGIGIQGMAVGSMGSVLAEALVVDHIREALGPENSVQVLPWFLMVFRLGCGGIVVKLFLKFATARDIASTVASGAAATLQVFCSFGFSFTQSLHVKKLMTGDFGCSSWGCYLTLFAFILFAVGGLYTQIKTLVLEKKQEAGDYEPTGRFEKLNADIQKRLKIIFELNHTLLEASKEHTPEQLAELAKEHEHLVVVLGQLVAFVVLIFSGLTIVAEMIEVVRIKLLLPVDCSCMTDTLAIVVL